MVQVAMNTVSPRAKRRQDRLAKLKPVRTVPSTVHVVPTQEEYRGVLKHPRGQPFRESGGADWPNDRFTTRRLADGSVKLDNGGQHAAAKAQPRTSHE